MSKPITDAVLRAILANLKEFGYPVTLEDVRCQVEIVKTKTERPSIIGMMAETMLRKGGYLE